MGARERLARLLAEAHSRWKLRRCASVGPGSRALGRVAIRGRGAVHVGARVLLDGRSAPIELDPHAGAEIRIGDDVSIQGGVTVEAQKRITIGEGSRLERFCAVMDNHFHPLAGDRLRPTSDAPLSIGARVVIGRRAIVTQGAHLEPGARVAAGAVVSRRVPAGTSYPPPPRPAAARSGEGG